MSSSSDTLTTTMMLLPIVVRDSRFRAGRTLVTRGEAERAVEIFSTLLQEARRTHGDEHFETVPAYYEYGNALLRASQHRQSDDGDDDEEQQKMAAAKTDDDGGDGSSPQKRSREAAAAAAERRAAGLKQPPPSSKEEKNQVKSEQVDNGEEKVCQNTAVVSSKKEDEVASSAAVKKEDSKSDDDDDDVQLALELMETAWSILDQYQETNTHNSTFAATTTTTTTTTTLPNYRAWATEQAPRILTGIGDVLSQLGRHADAADAYGRALQYREDAVAELVKNDSQATIQPTTLAFLQCRRRLVETYVLIAEELLACPPDQDVVTTETNVSLVSAAERVDYARGYYDKARDALQEAVLLMGELFAKQTNTATTSGSTPTREEMRDEKENVCFVATLVMGVGTTLAELDDEQQAATTKQDDDDDKKQPSTKKQKR